MRILFATNHTYPPQRAGGSESMTHDLCRFLQSRGIPVAVLASLSPEGFVGLTNRIKRKLLPRTRFPSDRSMGYRVFRGWKPVDGIPEVVRRFRPTVAVIQAGTPESLVEQLLRLRVPSALYLHDVDFEEGIGAFLTDPLLMCIANSSFTASRFMERFGVRPAVIPPCVEESRYRVASRRTKVVFIGLVPKKGIEVAFQLAEQRPDIPFEFVESWPMTDGRFSELTQRAQALGNVSIRRRVADMREIYRIARIVLVPSLCEEAWGRVCTEAQCSGIPVLGSNIGGIPESVGPGGLLVDVHAPLADWLAGLSVLWDDHASYVRLSEAALTYSQRKDIQFRYVVDELLRLLVGHVGSRRICETPAS